MLHIIRMINNSLGTDWAPDFTGVQPFVFDPTYDENGERAIQNVEVSDVLASPFSRFSIEMSEGRIGEQVCSRDEGDEIWNIECIFCEETAVGVYHILLELRLDDNLMYVPFWLGEGQVADCFIGWNDDNTGQGDWYYKVISSFLERLRSSKHGLVNYPGKAKFKTKSGRKATFKPTDVIYVGGGQNSAEPSLTPGGRKIRWQSSWRVMAHWRRLKNPESMGIGRDGGRNVTGYTWVNNYHKGDGAERLKIRRVK